MWRLFHNLHRVAARSVLNSVPQTSCIENGGSPVGYNQRLVFTSALPNTKHWEERYDRSWEKYKSKGNEGKRKSKSSKKTTECDWDDWFRSFTCTWWRAAGQQHVLEAVGWGTALLLGLHLSQYYKLWNCQHVRKCRREENWRCVGYHLHQLALALPVLGRENCPTNYMLPLPSPDYTPTTSTPIDVDEKLQQDSSQQQEFESFVHNLSQAGIWLEDIFDNEAIKSNIFVGDGHRQGVGDEPSPDLLAESRSDWANLDKLYVMIGRNLAASGYARNGHMSDAITLWTESSHLASSSYNLGVCHELGVGVEKNLELAAKFYSSAAKQGHMKATYNLGRLYLHGIGVQYDMDRAKELLQLAADNGITKALSDLAVLYSDNEQNMVKAAALFQKAALKKDMNGEYNLAVCYQYGLGVEQNLCKAAQFYSDAAHQGHKQAQVSLAFFFQQGIGGLPVDESYAEDWCSDADNLPSDNTATSHSNSGNTHTNTNSVVLRTPMDDHMMCQEVLLKSSSITSQGSDTKHLFYIPDSDSDSDSSIGTYCDTDESTGDEFLPQIKQGASFGDMPSRAQSSKEFSNAVHKNIEGEMAFSVNEKNSKAYEFPVEEGHFGDLFPRISLKGSFGDVRTGKSLEKSKYERQPHSVSDFRLFSYMISEMGVVAHEADHVDIKDMTKPNSSCSLHGMDYNTADMSVMDRSVDLM